MLISGQVVQQCGGHSDDSVLCAIKLYTVRPKRSRKRTFLDAQSQVSTTVAVDPTDDGLDNKAPTEPAQKRATAHKL